MLSTDGPMPTVEDVARAAGVSTATVSRVVNASGPVRPALREKVQAAVAALGYVPNAGARAMMLRRSGTVGAIFPTVDNAIFAKAIDALQRQLAESGLQLLLATSDYDPQIEARQAASLLTCGVDALVLCGTGQPPAMLQRLRRRGIPVVHVMSWPAPPGLVSVGFDNRRAMGKVVRYLMDLGHRRIAMLAGITRDNDRATARVAGVRETLRAAGLDLPPERLVERPYALGPAREGLRTLLAAAPAPTAIVCGNDVLAFGALLEAQEQGIAVPAALSIVGFDDLELAAQLRPALTTVRVPTAQLWRHAASIVVDALRRGEPAVAGAPEFEVDLVVRGSTGPAPTAPRGKARQPRRPG